MLYSDKLKNPLWQKKRLKIFERDNWKCLFCWSRERTLVVHHLYYLEVEPWEYPDEAFLTLCIDCHDFIGISIPEEQLAEVIEFFRAFNKIRSQLALYEKRIGAIYNPRLSRDIDASVALMEAIL